MKTKQEIISEFVHGITLDVGYAQAPNPFLKDVYGIDIVENKNANYKETHTVDLNAQPFPFTDKMFDTVLIGCTLAHVANPLSVLIEANRVLKPKGRLVVTSPNPHYYWEVVLNVFYNFFKNRVSGAKKEEHFYSFSRFDMRTICDRAGFDIETERGYLFALVKTKIRFNPINYPGIAYEIVYVCNKVREPEHYTMTQTSNSSGKMRKIQTNYVQCK